MTEIITRPQLFWLAADLHLGHRGILKHCSRPFRNVEEHDHELILRWNDKVQPKDWVYLLGDFSFAAKVGDIKAYADQLNGHIVFIRGNHDTRPDREYEEVFERCYHDGLASLNINGAKYHLCHWPMLAWRSSFRGRFHFFGHIHSGPLSTSNEKNLPVRQNSWDVGMDNNDYEPILLEDAIEKARSHRLWEGAK